MIDTIKLYLHCDVVSRESFSSVGRYIDNVHENVDTATGELWGNGTLKNMRIKYGGGYVSVEGSIGGYLFPNNSRIPKRQDVATAIEQLSDRIHLPMGKARVLRLDCGYHWNMETAVSEYLNCLKDITYFDRVRTTENTLRYSKGGKNETNRLVFYDKGRECKETNKLLLDGLGDNTLRYECRWLHRLNKQFGAGVLTASTLYDESFYRKMVSIWGMFYDRIRKSHRVSIDIPLLRDNKSAAAYIFGVLLNLDSDDVATVLQGRMKEQHSVQKGRHSDLRSSINKTRNSVCIDVEHDLTQELDAKVDKTEHVPPLKTVKSVQFWS